MIDVGWMWKVWCCVGHSVVGSGVNSQVGATQGVGTRRLSTMFGGVSAMFEVRHQQPVLVNTHCATRVAHCVIVCQCGPRVSEVIVPKVCTMFGVSPTNCP